MRMKTVESKDHGDYSVPAIETYGTFRISEMIPVETLALLFKLARGRHLSKGDTR